MKNSVIMKTRKLLLFSAALFLAIVSCKKDAEVNKDTFKIENEKVTATTQSVMITGSYAYSGAIDGITLELGRQTDLMDADAYRTLIEGTDFSVEVKNLRTNSTYYYRYAVEYGGKTPYYTDIKSFKTQEYNLPEVKSIEVVSVGVNRAEVSGEVLGDGGGDAVTLRGICWSMSHNPSVGDEYANAGEGIGTFTCELTNLQPEKTYYARAFAGNSKGVSYGEELTFVTMAAGSLAEVKTIGITGNANLQATVGGEVMNEGTSVVLERGVCYGKEHFPTTSGLHVSAGTGTGTFSCQLTNLEANATYYVRAYAINSLGIAYGDEMSFVAQTELTVPVVTTQMVSGITQTTATGHGVVVSDGGATVSHRGLCWSTEHNPTVADTHADCGNGVGEFSGMMPRLTDLTTYYVRAYAENAVGMAYGEEVSFTVGQHGHPVPPTVVTAEVTNISATTAVGGGNVTNDGGASVTERGICWSTNPAPTTSGSHASNGSGTGSYTCMMTGLTPGTTYYVRAYAVNSAGTGYGSDVEFTTEAGLPVVVTVGVTDITGTTAIGHGEVTEEGASPVTERGVCWSTSHNPTTSGSHANGGTGTGSFTCDMTGLTPSVTYYVRAYAVNSQGTSYGDEASFTALEGLPEVETGDVTDIGTTTATGHGEVTEEGASQVTERGICWSTDHNPTTEGSHASNGTGTGNYSVQMTGLMSHTTYFVKAYAINGQGIVYGAEVEFTTEAEPPTVVTLPVSNITQTTATGGGNVTDDGGSAVTERGICWSTSHDPTTGGSHATNGTGTGEYTVNMTGLTVSTTYYVRAYAINSKGLTYGEERNFVTSDLPQYTVNVSANPNEGGTVTGGGTYQQGQQCTVTATANSGYTFTNWTENGNVVSSSASYTFTVTGNRNLVANFGTNTYNINVSASPSNGGTVGGGGTYSYGQSCTVTATASTGYTFTNWTENGNVVSTNANYTFTVNSNRTLVAHFSTNTYAINVSASPSNGGTVGGGGTYSYGQSCTVTATASTGYTFTNWTENGNVVSNNASYTFTVTGNRSLMANFTLQTSLPTVTTSAVTDITQTTATGGGNVTNDGNATVTERGICWSTSHNPTISGNHASSGSGTGSFTVEMNNLTPNTTYYVRAYAVNSVGTVYGNEVEFVTISNIQIQIGEGTSTSVYFPFYTLYNYSIAENLFLSTELAEAGVTTAPMNSLSWYATNTTGYEQQGITIWMANVEDEALTTTSHITTGMTKVYTGTMTPLVGWNEFVFNQGSFAWDGISNILICVQRNNGSWNSSIAWQVNDQSFAAGTYNYRDSGLYDMTTQTYTMTTTTNRANIIFKLEQ